MTTEVILICILIPLYMLLRLRKGSMPSQRWQRRRNWRNRSPK